MEIFCDASYDAKRHIAGWGLVVKDGQKERTYSGWIPAENNNIGEIFAIHTACVLMGGKKGTIYTDSQLSVAYINNEVKEKPRTREQYFNHQKMKLWAYKIRRFGVNIEWLKGHVKTYKPKALGNSMADLCAKTGLSKYYLTLSEKRVR